MEAASPPSFAGSSTARRADSTARYMPYSLYNNRPAWASPPSPTSASGSKPVALRHTGQTAVSERPGLLQHPRHPCPARRFPARAVSQDVWLRLRRPAADGAPVRPQNGVPCRPARRPRGPGQQPLEDAALSLRGGHLQAFPARLPVHGSAQPPEGARTTPLQLPERPIALALAHAVALVAFVRLHQVQGGRLSRRIPVPPAFASLPAQLAGGLQGPAHGRRGGQRVPTLEHCLHQGLHGARRACLAGEPEQALVLHAPQGRYIEAPGQEALEDFLGPRAPRGAPDRLGRRSVCCRQGAPLDVRQPHPIQRHRVGQGAQRRLPHEEGG